METTNGTGLRQLIPYGLANSHDNGLAHWSRDGRKILFASAHGSLFTVRSDGAGLRAIPLKTAGGFSYDFTPGWSPHCAWRSVRVGTPCLVGFWPPPRAEVVGSGTTG